MHENADHQAALASSVGVGMLSFAHRPAEYHFSAWTVNTTACLYMNFELALTQMTCIICDDSGEPGSFKLRLQDAPGADAFNLTLSSCTFSQLLIAALKDSLFKLRFRRCILRCLWAVAKGVNQKSCRLYSISADISMALYIPYQRMGVARRVPSGYSFKSCNASCHLTNSGPLSGSVSKPKELYSESIVLLHLPQGITRHHITDIKLHHFVTLHDIATSHPVIIMTHAIPTIEICKKLFSC